MKSLRKPFTEITHAEIWIQPFQIHQPVGYIEPKNDETGQKFPNCCPFHKHVFAQGQAWFQKFPQCCDSHSEMARTFSIDKHKYSMMPLQAVQGMSYTEYIIEQRMNAVDWYEDITDYIDYIQHSFGKPAMGLHLYLGSLKHFLKNNIARHPKAKIERLLEFIEAQYRTPAEGQTDWNVLNDMYQKWLKEFPFDLHFFSSIKEQYHRPKLFFGEVQRRNRYINILKIKLHTKSSLMDELVKLTDNLLCSMNSLILHESGQLTDPQKLSAELAISKRRSELSSGYKNDSPNEEQRYRRMLKQWHKDELEFIKGITPLLKHLAPPIPERTQKLIDRLNKYKFAEFLKDRGHDPAKVYNLMAENAGREQMPYCIALMDATGYLQYFYTQFAKNKDEGHKKLAEVFEVNARRIKGNVNVLHPKSTEDSTEYTSVTYKETVTKQLEGRK